VNPPDGSLWVADSANNQVVHLGMGVRALTLEVFAVPTAVSTGGTTKLTALGGDNADQGIASWAWDDGNAGGSFASSGSRTPIYTAPTNLTGADQTITLTVTATGIGSPLVSSSASLTLTVHPAAIVLSSGYATPTSGDTWTRFTWRIKYWNTANQAPTSVWLAISTGVGATPKWCQMSALDPADTNYVDGAWFTYSSEVPAATYRFRFAAQANGGWIYWPQPAGTYQPGPTVAPGNPVVLSSGYVTPTLGTGDTTFTWRVKYWNTDNAMPDSVQVAIWFPTLKKTYWYAMWALDPADTNYKDGAWYTFSHKVPPAGVPAYAFRFAARQGANWTYWPPPAGSYQSGPSVFP
jgi:hypothetical protein